MQEPQCDEVELRKRGVNDEAARKLAGSSKGPWRLSHGKTLHAALPNSYFDSLGLHRLSRGLDRSTRSNRRVRTRMHGGVTGTAREGLPMSISHRRLLSADRAPALA